MNLESRKEKWELQWLGTIGGSAFFVSVGAHAPPVLITEGLLYGAS